MKTTRGPSSAEPGGEGAKGSEVNFGTAQCSLSCRASGRGEDFPFPDGECSRDRPALEQGR